MSLINKMLQDLDARGSQGGGAAQSDIRPVGRGERAVPTPVVMGALAGVLILSVGGVVGWRVLRQPPVAPVAVVVPAAPVQQAAIVPPEQLPVPEAAQLAAVAPPVAAAQAAAPAVKRLPAPQAAQPASPATSESGTGSLPAAREREMARILREQKMPAKGPASAGVSAPQAGRQAAGGQGAESVYRRGLSSLQDGRVIDAVAQLEQALAADPRHEAARQTLVGIQIEQGRTAEAMRLLQAGLALDARQPAMAMLLARMQIDSGASGIETLMTSLPAAGANGEYRAFLAGALQRERRHQEAVEQYQAALRSAPENSVWWMGLGISLEAEKRLPEALAAFQRARAGGNLSPELQGFIERKVGALGR
ncbi:tetratricopeptide repeat protein [Massilia atriviolacea]|uniref:Tetratricopeptide repeat protein n=1 Tax=Massilia atriviolacea TaxID=2495579 RepID=A0A430HRG7_9BURK|nr:tetratricopeptide repeat protein [Massilia atriviolacea]RSZ60106.1 tetratricopeptide repeat protein [Massilia atriviolacea]